MMTISNSFVASNFRQSTKREHNITNDFHLCTNFLLIISMIFGFFPLHGVFESHSSNLNFKWKSWMVLHCMFTMVSGLLVSMAGTHYVIRQPTIQSFSNFVFFFRGFLTSFLFLRLAQKWPSFLGRVQKMELILAQYPPSRNIRKQLKILNGLVLLLASVEHCLIQIDIFVHAVLKKDGDILLGFKLFFFNSYGGMFEIIPYTFIGGLWLQYVNVSSTFSWTFMDLFICSTSIIIASKIYQVSQRVIQLRSQEITSEDQWRQAREDFSKVYKIFTDYNRIFNPLFLLSFIVNIYFLLIQLFGLMKIALTISGILYYMLSFVLIVVRLTSVCLGGARIYEENKRLADILVTTPSYLYNKEIRRFVVHLKLSPTIISVDGYFYAYKGTLLTVLGALVAYEIILIQFEKELMKD